MAACREVATGLVIVGDVVQCRCLVAISNDHCQQTPRMARFAPLHTGQFIIRPRVLRRRRTLLAGLLLLVVLVTYSAYELGRMRGGYSVISSQRERFAQNMRISSLQGELNQLRRELGNVRLDRKVDQQSSDSMRQSFADLQATIQRQQEELTLYKAIVTPDGGAPTEPQVQRFEVQPDTVANRYRLQLVLIQPMQASGNAQGTVQLQVSGTRQGQPLSLALPDVAVDKKDTPLRFSYRYFQTLEQLVELPADFQPLTMQVEMHAAQHAVQHQEFAWQLRTP